MVGEDVERLERKAITASAAEAVSTIRDGMILALGGFATASKPMALVREIIRQGIKNLTVITTSGGIEIDLLIAAGAVRRVISPYVGLEALAAVCPFYRWALQRSTVESREVDVGIVVSMLRAARDGLPFQPWRGGTGSSLPDLNPDLKIIEDPFHGERLLAVPAVCPDVALIHAAQADAYGNVQHLGSTFSDALMAQAAKRTIVQVERIVSNEEIRRAPELTTVLSFYVDAVVAAPYGAHPLFSQRHYLIDQEHIGEYLRAAVAFLAGEKEAFEQYMSRYVFGARDHAAYLATVGIERILALR